MSCGHCDNGVIYVPPDVVTECPDCAQVAKTGPLSPRDARKLTSEVKRDAAGLWRKLRELHEREAWRALGYSSWASYCKHEFDLRQSHAYRMLDAARVVDALPEGHSPMGERVARELVPVLRDIPERVPEVLAEVVQLLAAQASWSVMIAVPGHRRGLRRHVHARHRRRRPRRPDRADPIAVGVC